MRKRGALAIDGSYNLIKRSRSGRRGEFSRWGSSMNSLGLAGRGAILALGTLMSMVTVSCGLIEELSGSEQDSAASSPPRPPRHSAPAKAPHSLML